MRTVALCLLTTAVLLSAAEPRLQTGPIDLWGRVALLSRQVDRGAARTDDVTMLAHATGRYFNIGLHGDVFVNLDSDDTRDLKSGDITEVRMRLDYAFELPDYAQILPYFQYSTFPAHSDAEEPAWLGVEGWYLTPVEGLEAGVGFAYDAGDEYGWHGFIAARQFYQQAPLDLVAWQMLHFGDKDYRRFVGGNVDKQGITTVEVGAEALVPLPWLYTWLSAGIEAHWWAKSSDRQARGGESLETMFYLGFDMRLE